MKKIVAFVTATVLSLSMLAGCGAKEVKLDEVMSKINTENSLSLKQIESVDKLNAYYSIDANDVKQFAAEQNGSSDASVEIVFVEAVDSAAADRVQQALTDRYNTVLRMYKSYSPEQVAMVEACQVNVDGNFVNLVIAENADEIVGVFNDSIK